MNRQPARICLSVILGIAVGVTAARELLALRACRQGWNLIECGSVREAISCFEDSLAWDPWLATGHMGLGVALWTTGRPSPGTNELTHAYSCDVRGPEVKLSVAGNLGTCASRWGDLFSSFRGSVRVRVKSYALIISEPCLSGEGEHTNIVFFLNQRAPEIVDMRFLEGIAAPLAVQRHRGDFRFSRISGESGSAIRVRPIEKGNKGRLKLQFGYTLLGGGADIKCRPGQKVSLELSARLSDESPRWAVLFVEDDADKRERKSVVVRDIQWKQYTISKEIREGASKVRVGVYWKPKSEDEWLEIKDLRVFVGCPEERSL